MATIELLADTQHEVRRELEMRGGGQIQTYVRHARNSSEQRQSQEEPTRIWVVSNQSQPMVASPENMNALLTFFGLMYADVQRKRPEFLEYIRGGGNLGVY